MTVPNLKPSPPPSEDGVDKLSRYPHPHLDSQIEFSEQTTPKTC